MKGHNLHHLLSATRLAQEQAALSLNAESLTHLAVAVVAAGAAAAVGAAAAGHAADTVFAAAGCFPYQLALVLARLL